jgi:hypothetical protein
MHQTNHSRDILFVCEGPLTTHVFAAMEACTAEIRVKTNKIQIRKKSSISEKSLIGNEIAGLL